MTRWSAATGGGSGRDYAARFDALAAQGTDVHGEASFCTALVPPPSRVLDAGCGTGRVAIRLAELGHDVTGVDLDLVGDGETMWDLVVMAGNIVPLVAEGTEPRVVERLAAHVAPGGLLVAGFGLDRAHLPPAGAVVDITAYDGWCAAAGLEPLRRLATWDGQPWTPDAGYAVSVHQRSGPVTSAG